MHNFFAICYLSRSNWDSTEKLRQAIHTYIDFYNNHRIKIGLNGKTITEHRAMIAQNV